MNKLLDKPAGGFYPIGSTLSLSPKVQSKAKVREVKGIVREHTGETCHSCLLFSLPRCTDYFPCEPAARNDSKSVYLAKSETQPLENTMQLNTYPACDSNAQFQALADQMERLETIGLTALAKLQGKSNFTITYQFRSNPPWYLDMPVWFLNFRGRRENGLRIDGELAGRKLAARATPDVNFETLESFLAYQCEGVAALVFPCRITQSLSYTVRLSKEVWFEVTEVSMDLKEKK